MSAFVDWEQAPVDVGWAGSVDDGSAFGIDASAIPDLSTATEATGYLSLGEAIYRRLISPRGSLFYDPDYGFDLRQWIHQHGAYGGRSGLYATLATLVAQECEKDPRVVAATVDVVQYDTRTGSIRVTCELSEGLVRFLIWWTSPGEIQWRLGA